MMEVLSGGLFFRLAVRNVFRNRRRSLLTLLGIIVGVWGTVGLSAFARGVSDQMAENAIRNMIGHIQIHQGDYLNDPSVDNSMAPLPEAAITWLDKKKFPWSPRVRVAAVALSERESAGVTLVGVDPNFESRVSFFGDGVVRGQGLQDAESDGVIIGKALAEDLKTSIGKRIVLMAQDANQRVADRGFRVVGIFDAELENIEKSFVFVGLKRAQQMLELHDKISEVAILTNDRLAVESDVAELRKLLPQLDVQPWSTIEPLLMAIKKLQDGFLQLWYLIVIVTVAFGVVNTLFMAIFERAREIGLMQAIGMKPFWLVWQVLLESLVIVIVGAIAGNLLSFVTVYFFRHGIDVSAFAEGTAIIGVGRIIVPVIKQYDVIKANLLICAIVLLSSFYPAWRASRIDPVSAMRKA